MSVGETRPELDIKNTTAAKAHRYAFASGNTSVVYIDQNGFATEVYKVGKKEGLTPKEALDAMLAKTRVRS